MIHNHLKTNRYHTILLLLIVAIVAPLSANNNFPLRSKYPGISVISTKDLAKEYGSIIIVDVRSAFEYDVIHVAKAQHVPISKVTFGKKLEKILGGDTSKKVAFYCNGHTCAKSYKATRKAKELGFTNVLAFDAGIFEWTMANPNKAALLGKTPADTSKIIPKSEFKKRLLAPELFKKEIATMNNVVVIDARDPIQRKKSPNYKVKAKLLPMDKLSGALSSATFKKQVKGKTIYIYDATGKQVRWLQYHLEANGFSDYYFLKGGVWSLFGEKGANK